MVVNTEGMKQRKTAVQSNGKSLEATPAETRAENKDDHPSGPVKHGGPMQALRIFLFTLFFTTSCLL